MCIERYTTSISHSTIKDFTVPVTIEYLSEGIKVGIIDIYLDADVLFGEDIFKAGMAFFRILPPSRLPNKTVIRTINPQTL